MNKLVKDIKNNHIIFENMIHFTNTHNCIKK